MSDINSWSTTDASNNATPPDGFPENMAYSAVNNAARAVMGGMKRFFADIGGSLAASGSADVYTVTLNAPYAAYFEGMVFTCSIPADCTGGAVTINANSIGAATVTTRDGAAPPLGSLKSGGLYTFRYDGTNFQFEGSLPSTLSITTYSENASQYTATTGTRALDVSLATYFYPSADLGSAVITFTFDNPASTGRVSSFTMELLGADGATLTWPASVVWANGTEPTWTSGIDVVGFTTRDGGTTWIGFIGGLDFS